MPVNAEPLRLLLLEDNPSDAVLAQEYLSEDRKRRYEITHCTSLEEALSSARLNPCNVALLDLFVPDSQGLDTLRSFKDEFPDAAVLVLTGLDDEDLAVEAVELGALDYVVKSSLSTDVLSRSLRHALARRKLEQRLWASEESYRELFLHSLDGVARTAPDGSIFEVNQAFAEMLGYSLDELRDRRLRREEVVDLNDPRVMAAVEERRRTGHFRGEMNFVRKDGSVFPVELTTSIYIDEDGQERTSMIVRDVSEQRANEQRVSDYQEQLARSEEVSLVMAVHTDLDGRWLMVPPRFCALLGYSEDELLAMRYQDITHPDDLEESVGVDREIVSGSGGSLDIEKRYLHKDGRTVWVYLNSTIVTDNEGRPVHFRKYVRDITAERDAEEQAVRNYELLLRRITALAEDVSLASEPVDVYRSLFEFALASTPADAMIVADFDPSTKVRTCVFAADTANGAIEETDVSALPDFPLSESPQSRAIRERKAVVSNDFQAAMKNLPTVAYGNYRADSPPRASVAIPMLIDNEVIGAFELQTTSDVPFTEKHSAALQMAADIAAIATKNLQLLKQERVTRKQAEAERERLKSILQQAPALMATFEGPDHVLAQANPAFLEFFPARDMLGRALKDTMPELVSQGIIEILTSVFETGTSHVDTEMVVDLDRHGDGHIERHYFNLVLQSLRDADGAIAGVLVNAVPITEQVQARKEAERMTGELEAAYQQTITGWARALDLRDEETAGHSQRVTDMTVVLARRFGMTKDELVNVRRGALLHDIGKMGVPDEILLKTGKLTPEEWEIMKGHAVFGRDLLQPIAFLESAIDIPYCHHEKWDGSGYPRGLKGEEIPLAARIFAVVDVYDALMSDRPYRKAWTHERVVEYLREQAGSHLDPNVVEAFLDLLAGPGGKALARAR